MTLTQHSPNRAITAVVRVIRTVNSVYVLTSHPGDNMADLTCVSGTFHGLTVRIDLLASDVPHEGSDWRIVAVAHYEPNVAGTATLHYLPKAVFPNMRTSEIQTIDQV